MQSVLDLALMLEHEEAEREALQAARSTRRSRRGLRVPLIWRLRLATYHRVAVGGQ